MKYPFIVGVTTISWIVVTFLTPPEKNKVLFHFYRKTQPGGPGWKKVKESAKKEKVNLEEGNHKWAVPTGILAVITGTMAVYGCLFSTGKIIYGQYESAIIYSAVTVVFTALLIYFWRKLRGDAF